MFRLSTCFFMFFNILAFISSCVAIISYIYFQTHGITECQKLVQTPLLVIGVITFVMSLLGIIGTWFRATCLLWFYSFLALLVLVGVTAFTVIAYRIRNPTTGENFLAMGFKKHHVGDYSQWLQNLVQDENHWSSIRSCLIKHEVCESLVHVNIKKPEDFNIKGVSYVQNGCCRPPKQCGYKYKNGTYWEMPKSSSSAMNRPSESYNDCNIWSNDQDKLCYDCKTCRIGVLEMTMVAWKLIAIVDIIDTVILLLVFVLSCCTRKNIISDRKYHRGYTSVL